MVALASKTRSRRESMTVIGVFAVIAVMFFLVGRWGETANVDVIATNGPAWRLTNAGTLESSFLEGRTLWLVEDSEGRLVSNRPPGLIAVAVPAYALARPSEFSNAPGTLTALVVTLGSLVVLYLVLRGLFEWQFALAVIAVLALGTTTWTTSAAQLWPHGPGQLAAALAVAATASLRYTRAGLSFAAAILMRPVTAIAAAVTGLRESWRQRRLRPALAIGAMSFLGMSVLLLYNRLLFGAWSIRGGYSGDFTLGALGRYGPVEYLENLYDMFIGLPNGLFLFAPVVAVSSVGLVWTWREVPDWARSLVLAGLTYLLVHAAVNRASGGMPIFYRYPLEALTLATPALAFGALHLWDRDRLTRIALKASIAVSLGFHGAMAFGFSCLSPSSTLLACRLLG